MTEQTKFWADIEGNEVFPVPASEDLENTFDSILGAEMFLVDLQVNRLEHLRDTYLNK